MLIEDFDTNSTVKRRSSLPIPVVNPIPAPAPINRGDDGIAINIDAVAPAVLPVAKEEEFSMLSMSALLNALDGIVPLDGMMIFLTTNHIEQIDPAVIRKGRVDRHFEIPYLTDAEVCRYIELMFPNYAIGADVRFHDIAGCDLMALFSEHRDSVEGFVAAIPQREATVDEMPKTTIIHRLATVQ